MYGPVRTVVWQGSAGDRRPYADQTLVLYRKRAFAEEDSGSKALWRAFDRAV